jgi:hypothetical protein
MVKSGILIHTHGMAIGLSHCSGCSLPASTSSADQLKSEELTLGIFDSGDGRTLAAV